MPKFTVPQIGAQMGTDNDDNLKMTPKEAVKRYADVLQNGDKSQYAGDFDNDYLRQELATLFADRATGHGAQQGHANADLRGRWVRP